MPKTPEDHSFSATRITVEYVKSSPPSSSSSSKRTPRPVLSSPIESAIMRLTACRTAPLPTVSCGARRDRRPSGSRAGNPASFLIDILQGVKVSSSKLKKIFYENKTLPIRNPIYSQYNGQTIDAIIIDDTKSKRRSGGRPSIKGALGLDLETGEEFLLYLGAVRSWSEVLSHIGRNYNISDEMYAICDGDDNLQQHLEDYGYRIQQCTNHFVKTSMYYLWKEQYPKEERMRIKNDFFTKNRVKTALRVGLAIYFFI